MLNPLAVGESIREKEDPMVRLRLLKLDWWPNDLLKKNELIMRKYFHRSPCLSLFELFCPLWHISIMRFDIWTLKLPF